MFERCLGGRSPDFFYIVTVFDAPFTIPSGKFDVTEIVAPLEQRFQTSIRIIGKGIEEEVKRFLDIRFRMIFWREKESDNVEDICWMFVPRITEIRMPWKKKSMRLPYDPTKVPRWFDSEAKKSVTNLK